MAKMQYCGTGRRKSSVARVRLVPGNGNITVNKKPLDDYFGMELLKREVRRPLQLVGAEGKFDVIATVYGGGTTGQSGALRHGISRALCQADPENRPALKAAGFLGSRIPDQRPENEGKKEVRSEEGQKSFPVLQALICTHKHRNKEDGIRSGAIFFIGNRPHFNLLFYNVRQVPGILIKRTN